MVGRAEPTQEETRLVVVMRVRVAAVSHVSFFPCLLRLHGAGGGDRNLVLGARSFSRRGRQGGRVDLRELLAGLLGPGLELLLADHLDHDRHEGVAGAAGIGRASWRERVCQYVSNQVGAVTFKKKKKKKK